MAEAKQIYTPPLGLWTQLDTFREYINQKYKLDLSTYHQLHDFSVTRLNDFWMTVWEFCDIKASKHPSKAIDDDARIDAFPSFFEDARLNYAENLLCGKDEKVAVIEMNEVNLWEPRKYTWRQLRELTARYAGVLRREEVGKGDVVCCECDSFLFPGPSLFNECLHRLAGHWESGP